MSTAPEIHQPQLPPELHDYIIDHLENDKRALSVCALVSKEWSTRSQYHLFRRMTITLPSTLDDLIDFLRSHPRLASFIRRLALCGGSGLGDISYNSQFHITVTGVANCMAELPAAEELILHGVWWTDDRIKREANFWDTISRSCTTTQLVLRKVFVTPDTLFDTVCCFPQLQSIHTENVYWTMGIDRPERCVPILPNVPSLKTISVGAGSSYNMLKYFFPALRERTGVSELRSLTVNFDHLDPSSETKQFMGRVGNNLEHLRVIFGNHILVNSAIAERFIDTLQLEICRSLLDFEITLPGTVTSVVPPPLAWSLLSLILPKLPPTTRTLTIAHRLDLDSLQANLHYWDWKAFDSALCGFPALQSVTIKAETTEFTSDACEMYIFDADDAYLFWKDYVERSKLFFKRNLPQLSERKILSFQF